MRKEELFNDEFFKQFKSGKEFESFLSGLHHHPGYDKHARTGHSNARNGYGSKTIKTDFGEARIDVPRDRDSSFEPAIVPKRESMDEGIESLVVSLYAKGMSNADIEEQLHEIYDFRLSTSAISRITDRVSENIVAWQNRPLEEVYMIVWMDGIVFKVRENSKVVNKTVYIAVDSAGTVRKKCWASGSARMKVPLSG
ncbi:Transposase, Mutator family [anaerobic digester metagenome]